MLCKIEKNYLVFPVSRHAARKNLAFCDASGVCVFDITLRLDYENPDRDVYIDVKRFKNTELDISVQPQMRLSIKEKDRMPVCRFREALRPKYHFTAPEGWLNDPNGMVYANGVYHLFYQLNPAEVQWGNMHWGHAASNNLTDWEHRNIALFPDSYGTMFSGGAIADTANILGMKNSAWDPLVLYYTAAGDKSRASAEKPFTQCMAVSLDGGATFSKLPSNPIIPHIEAENRDPKVVYSESLGLYVMSLYLDGDRYALFTSENLRTWDKVQEFSLCGDNECPSFFPMKNDLGQEKWIFMGAHDRYIVGKFDGKTYTAEHEGTYSFTYSDRSCSYAAQKFENIGERCIRIAWMKTDFASFGADFNSCMSFPQELTLASAADGDRLKVRPAAEISKLHGKKVKGKSKAEEFGFDLKGIAQDICLSINACAASKITVSVFGASYVIDTVKGEITDGRFTAPLAYTDGELKIRLLTDTCGIEAYLFDGSAYMVYNSIPDVNLSTLSVSSDSEITLKLEAFRLRDARMTDKRR